MFRKTIKKVIRLTLASAMMVFVLAFAAFASENLEVHFIDVGQADAALIMCDGHNMLIDGGNADDSQLIYSYLKNHGVSSLDYIVNSHGDEDHVGGIPGAIQLVGGNIGTVFAPYTDLDKDRFQVFKRKLADVGKDITVPEAGSSYQLGPAVFRFLSSGGAGNTDRAGDNESLVLRVTYGSTSFLFMGDAGEEQEKAVISSGYEVESDVLKVGHHGSRTSTCYQFLRAVCPKTAVISVGADNSYGHPTDDALSKLRDAGATVLRTDNNGHIVISSDGTNLQYSVQKEAGQEKNLIPGGGSSAGTLTSAGGSSVETLIPEAADQNEMTRNTAASGNEAAQAYVLNKNSNKFHYPNCSSVGKMKAKNREDVVDTRENIIARGYDPCKNCNP